MVTILSLGDKDLIIYIKKFAQHSFKNSCFGFKHNNLFQHVAKQMKVEASLANSECQLANN
jgi:hypothetical protein